MAERERRCNKCNRGVVNMAEKADATKNPLNNKLPGNIVGAIKHHIRVLEIAVTNIQ